MNNQFNHSGVRLRALIKKEFLQLARDNSSLLLGIALPIMLIFIFGYGLSLDVRNSRIAIVSENTTADILNIVARLKLSPYFKTFKTNSLQEAKQLLKEDHVDGVLYFQNDFSKKLNQQEASILFIINGTDANKARIIQSYVSNAFNNWQEYNTDRLGNKENIALQGNVTVIQRLWFNEANSSTWFLVPGVIVLIITLVGSMLTAMIMAKEWERGTLESLFITPVHPIEIIIAKIIPYFVISIVGMFLCLIAARWLFMVPIRGSLLIIIFSSSLYLIVALAIGLLISSITKSQFAASQIALLVSFLPAMMLSGFIFDLRSTPAIIQFTGQLLPSTYFMELIRTLFLAGNVWSMIIKNSLILIGYIILLLSITLMVTRKRLD
ncbi:ABC transporter permease [Entomomonas moraniae]|uniref:ABC transporter permease n=1 Tax=Entomomonas moraniae TaxID=2213226 RepID=A0A3S9XCN6_9GAMM|nr:ABC transporter permease [Entomomonas moraniae]AZS50111.1 ABC transporter permease [Entomomonas moraniae]